MSGSEMASNYQRPDLRPSGRVRTDTQSVDGSDKHGISYCVSCASRLSRSATASDTKEKFWRWTIVILSTAGLIGSAIAFLWGG